MLSVEIAVLKIINLLLVFQLVLVGFLVRLNQVGDL